MKIFLERKPNTLIAHALHINEHQFIADVTAADGGEDLGPSPHDLYDAALASCKALTVMWYANKRGIKIEQLETRIERNDEQERQGVYKLETTLKIKGNFSDQEFNQLVAVAEKCPIHKLMTSVVTEITTKMERIQ